MNKKIESGGVSESDFENAFEQIQTIKFSSIKDNKVLTELIKVGLKSKDWQKRVEQLHKLSAVVKGLKENDDILSVVRSLENELNTCITDLRSQVVREACICVAYLSVRLTTRFECAVEPFADSLMLLVPNGTRIMSSSGKVALKVIYQNTQTKRLVSSLRNILSYSKSVPQRQFCCELLCIICNEWMPKKVQSCMLIVCDALTKGINDCDNEVRTLARRAFFSFHTRFTVQADSLLKSIDSGKRSLIMKEISSGNNGKISPDKASFTNLQTSIDVIPQMATEHNLPKSSIKGVTQTGDHVKINEEITLKLSLEQAMHQLNSRVSKERRQGLIAVAELLVSPQLYFSDMDALKNCFNLYFLENDSDVRQSFLCTLSAFLRRFLDNVESTWTESLLVKLLTLKVSPHRSDCVPQIDTAVYIISSHNPNNFMTHCLGILTKEAQPFNPAFSFCVCELLLATLNISVFEVPQRTLSVLITVMVTWVGDTRNPSLQKVSRDILLRLAHLDNDRFQQIVQTFPCHLQQRLRSNIEYNNRRSRIPQSPRRSSTADSISRQSRSVPFSALAAVTGPVEHSERAVLTACDLNVPQHGHCHYPRSPCASSDTTTAQHTPSLSSDRSPCNTVTHVHPIKTAAAVTTARQTDTESSGVSQMSLIIHILKMSDDTKQICHCLMEIAAMADSSQYSRCIDRYLTEVCHHLSMLISHHNATIRKHCILTLVSLQLAAGPRLWSLIDLDHKKKALFDIYAKKAQRSQNKENIRIESPQ